MRARVTIENDGSRKDILQLEVLLDIRELLEKQHKLLKPKRAKKVLGADDKRLLKK